MSVTVTITGVLGPTGSMLRAGLFAPGDALGSVPTNQWALTEDGTTGEYNGTSGALTLTDDATDPYQYAVREVTSQTNGAWATGTPIVSRGDYGYLVDQQWIDHEPHDVDDEAEAAESDNQIVLTRTITVAGLTVTSVTLTALTDANSDAVTIPGGGTFTSLGSGVYRITVAPGSAPGPFAYTYRVAFTNGQYVDRSGETAADDEYSGRYTTEAILSRKFGIKVVDRASNSDGTNTRVSAEVQAAIETAEAEIDAYFGGSHYTVPFVFDDGVVSPIVQRWATVLAFDQLFGERRGTTNDDDAKRFEKRVAQVRGEMATYRLSFRTIPGVAINSAAQTAPQPIAPEYDINGLPNNTTTRRDPIAGYGAGLWGGRWYW